MQLRNRRGRSLARNELRRRACTSDAAACRKVVADVGDAVCPISSMHFKTPHPALVSLGVWDATSNFWYIESCVNASPSWRR